MLSCICLGSIELLCLCLYSACGLVCGIVCKWCKRKPVCKCHHPNKEV